MGDIGNPGDGYGSITLQSSASLTLTGPIQIGSVAFDSGDVSIFGALTRVTSVLSRFGSGDTTDLSGIQDASLSYAGGTLTLFGPNQPVVDMLSFSGEYTQQDFGLKSDGSGGTEIAFTGQDGPQSPSFTASALSIPAHEDPLSFTRWHSALPSIIA